MNKNSEPQKRHITLLDDNPDGWFMSYARRLQEQLAACGHQSQLTSKVEHIQPGDMAFFLSCQNIIKPDVLKLNKHNLVVHASDLPQGKGWSPLTWKILESCNEIPVTLFEAVERVDAGPIYYQETLSFEGHELIDEMREALGSLTVELCMRFVENYPNVQGTPQSGEETFYPRRKPKDSEISPYQTIAEQFNQLRVADNERYPAYFQYNDHTYILKIEKALYQEFQPRKPAEK